MLRFFGDIQGRLDSVQRRVEHTEETLKEQGKVKTAAALGRSELSEIKKAVVTLMNVVEGNGARLRENIQDLTIPDCTSIHDLIIPHCTSVRR